MNVAANKMNSERKIIVIEDDRDISELIAYNLRKHGYSCEQVFNGVEAVDEIDSLFDKEYAVRLK